MRAAAGAIRRARARARTVVKRPAGIDREVVPYTSVMQI